jgi:hypothetical protein
MIGRKKAQKAQNGKEYLVSRYALFAPFCGYSNS